MAGNRRKAIDGAWEYEKELVIEGQGTRDWTEEEQAELLDKGSIKGYEGHHMKCVEKYPDYADNPENIQFLKKNEEKNEHILAHNGHTQNPTNGYYDYETGKTIEFGEDELVSSPIRELSSPIIEQDPPTQEKALERANAPPSYDDRPPPTQEDMLENLREIKQEEQTINEDIRKTNAEKINHPSYREARRLDNTADEMERISRDNIEPLQGEKARNQALERFENEFGVKYENAPAKIKENRENAAELKKDLEPFDEKAQSLTKSKDQNTQEYQNQLDRISSRPDAQEIMDKWEKEQKTQSLKHDFY